MNYYPQSPINHYLQRYPWLAMVNHAAHPFSANMVGSLQELLRSMCSNGGRPVPRLISYGNYLQKAMGIVILLISTGLSVALVLQNRSQQLLFLLVALYFIPATSYLLVYTYFLPQAPATCHLLLATSLFPPSTSNSGNTCATTNPAFTQVKINIKTSNKKQCIIWII